MLALFNDLTWISPVTCSSAVCLAAFSTHSCAIHFIATVEIASVIWGNNHERKVAKEQEVPEMDESRETSGPPQECC